MVFKRLTLVALSVTASAMSAAGGFSGTYEIINAGSGMLLEDPGFSTNNGTDMDQWTGNSGGNQQWTFTSLGNGQYKIINYYTGLALDVVGQSQSAGAAVDQWAYWGGANQRWTIQNVGEECYEISNVNSSLPLEVQSQSLSDGGSIDQGTWSNGSSQKWYIVSTNVSGARYPTSGGHGVAAAAFHGFNWADPNDNYIDGPLLLTGLSIGQSHSEVVSVARTVLGAFQGAGANTIRIPINPETALGSWWSSYRGVIDEATSRGFKVIIANWTGSGNSGTVNDLPSAFRMWDAVVSAYNGNGNVYFEILNEPYGYSASGWLSVVSQWLSRYPTVPRGRVFVGGTGYCQNIPAVAWSSVTSGCLFSCHDYGFWNPDETSDSWFYYSLLNEVGNYSKRTVLTEFGGSMNQGWNYRGSDQGNYQIASVKGFCNYCRATGMGSTYWAGLKNGDWYSMFSLNGATVSLESSSGLAVLRSSW